MEDYGIIWPVRRVGEVSKCHSKLKRPLFCHGNREYYVQDVAEQLRAFREEPVFNIRKYIKHSTFFSETEQKVILFDAMQSRRVPPFNVVSYARGKPWMCAQSTFFFPQLFASKVEAQYSKPHKVVEMTVENGQIYTMSETPLYIPNELNSEGSEFDVLNTAQTGFGPSSIKGKAVTLDGIGYRNRVSFGPFFDFFSNPPWYGNYAIIDFDQRDPISEWVVVGDLDLKYLWFLYRIKVKMSKEEEKRVVANLVERMRESAEAFGYTKGRLDAMVRYF